MSYVKSTTTHTDCASGSSQNRGKNLLLNKMVKTNAAKWIAKYCAFVVPNLDNNYKILSSIDFFHWWILLWTWHVFHNSVNFHSVDLKHILLIYIGIFTISEHGMLSILSNLFEAYHIRSSGWIIASFYLPKQQACCYSLCSANGIELAIIKLEKFMIIHNIQS